MNYAPEACAERIEPHHESWSASTALLTINLKENEVIFQPASRNCLFKILSSLSAINIHVSHLYTWKKKCSTVHRRWFLCQSRVKSTQTCKEENLTIKMASMTGDFFFFMGFIHLLKTMMPTWTLNNLKAFLERKKMESWYYRKTLNVFCIEDNSVAGVMRNLLLHI